MPQHDAGSFVAALAARLEPEVARLAHSGFVQASSEPLLAYRHRVLGLPVRTVLRPGGVECQRLDDALVLTTSGDRSFGGPLDLGAGHQVLLDAGYGVRPRKENRVRQYRAEVPGHEHARAALLTARTLAVLGAEDPEDVEVVVEAEG